MMRPWSVLASVFVAGLSFSPNLWADEHVRGVIRERGGNGTMMVQTANSTVIVNLDDRTKVRRTDGARQLKMSSATLVPGLRVNVEGAYGPDNKFAAKRITFTRTDLKTALAIEGGIQATDQRSLENQRRIEQNAQLLKQQQQILGRQAQQIAANEQKIIATNGALEATGSRIANLDNYNVIRSVTVYFSNGKAAIASKYKTELQELASQAKDVNGYMVQVQGYASHVGPDKFNQKLSMERADNVTSVLQQSGIPLTALVVPAAMGTTDQLASNETKEGQAQNRRTVVTLLQNKGIAGK